MSRKQAADAFDALVSSLPYPSGSVAIAMLDQAGFSVSPCRLSKWRSDEHEEQAPFSVVWALQVQSGKTIASDLMGAAVGSEDIGASLEVLASQATMLAAKANAKVTATRCPNSPGGRETTPREASECIKDIDKAVDALMATRRSLEGLSADRTAAE